MKYLFSFFIIIFFKIGTFSFADISKYEINKEDKKLINIFKKTCENLTNKFEFKKIEDWELDRKKNNQLFIKNSKTSEDLIIKIIKRGPNNKTFRFTFSNILGPKLFITSDSNCRVNLSRIILKDYNNHTLALLELTKDLINIKKVELINAKVPSLKTLPTGVKIALIDTGINYLLPELTKKISRISPTELLGYDFDDNDNLPYDVDFISSPFFPRYHGTSVASIILKEAPNAQIAPFKFSRKNYCTFGDIIKRIRENNIKIALLSMGSKNKKNWECFFNEAKKSKNILFVVSAGNDNLNIDIKPIYPASFNLENIIVISSSTLFGDIAKGSNYGKKSVDFIVNGEQLEVFDHRGVRSIASGSSYAAPRLAAMAARFFSKNPNADNNDFKSVLIKRAISHPTQQVKYGWIPDPLDNYLF